MSDRGPGRPAGSAGRVLQDGIAFGPLDPASVERYAAYVGELLLHGISAKPSPSLSQQSSQEK
ncbi:MAG: hypothetical protein AAEJ52_03625 [Myxococcota bacterium]